MTTKASCETLQPEVITCIAHLRAYAAVLANDSERSDDLVCETIAQTFTAIKGHAGGINLKVLMFTVLRKLHYGSRRRSIEGAARQLVRLSGKDDGIESDELLVVFYRLRDDQREVLILEVASDLSYEEAAEVCDCEIDTFGSRLWDAKRAISRMLREASRERKMNFATRAKKRIHMLPADAVCAE